LDLEQFASQPSGSLKVQPFGGFLQPSPQSLKKHLVTPIEKANNVAHEPPVLIPIGPANARAKAATEIQLDAW